MLAQLPKPVIDRIMVSQSGKAITALVWKAGLGMRVAVKIQTRHRPPPVNQAGSGARRCSLPHAAR
jgi:hypothetical protein